MNIAQMANDFANTVRPNFIIGGWYTPDYEKWKVRLEGDIVKLDLPYHFIAVEKPEGSWETITRMKAEMAAKLLREAEDKILILVDADARMLGPRESIIAYADIKTDIALRFSGKISRSRGTTKLHPWSGTMILRPTAKTFEFLDAWTEAGIDAPKLATDEATLGAALATVSGLTMTMLPHAMCAAASQQEAVVRHPHRTGARSSKWKKLFNGMVPW